MRENYILTKDIDWSFLSRGFAIPVTMQYIISKHLANGELKHGEKRYIKIMFNNQIHDANISSVNFNREVYPNHKEIWQILYPKNGTFASAVRKTFNKTFEMLSEMRKYKVANKEMIKIPKNEREFIALYTTDVRDVFYIEPFFNKELSISGEENEQVIENLLDFSDLTDYEANIVEKYHLQKVRKLNRGIGEYLKKIYSFRCQICGESVGENYGSEIAECHHIRYFVRSLNNDANNLMILCPNHHRIIHSTNPMFDFKEKIFRYSNGYMEGLKLNLHL